MKALLISDDNKVVSPIKDFLLKNDIDIIIYKWLVKALDNIEEIQPDIIILNSSEYPRHWKTLVQFVKGLGVSDVKIYLYEPQPLSVEEEEKYKVLGVNGYFTSLTEDSLGIIIGKIPLDQTIGKILITNPFSGEFEQGNIACFENEVLKCTGFNDCLSKDDYIKYVSFSMNDDYKSCSGKVLDNDDGVLQIKVQKYHEEI